MHARRLIPVALVVLAVCGLAPIAPAHAPVRASQEVQSNCASCNRALEVDQKRCRNCGTWSEFGNFDREMEAGQKAYDGKKLDEAYTNFNRASTRKVRSIHRVRAYALAGKTALELRRFSDAETHLLEAIRIQPEAWEPYLYLGEASYRLGKYAEAEKHLKKATDLSGRRELAAEMLGLIALGRKQYADARTHFKNAADAGVKSARVEYGIAYCILQLDGASGHAEAEQRLQSSMRMDPEYIDPVIALAVLYEFTDRLERACDMYQRAVQLDPKSVELRKELATMAIRIKRYGAAREAYQWLVENQPEVAEGHYGLATVDLAEGQNYRAALPKLKRARDLKPSLPGIDLMVCIVEAYASGNKGMVFAPSNATDRGPSWSPDGSRMVFQSSRKGDMHIFTAHIDGSNVRQLTSTGKNERPSWSPDGRFIAFQSERGGNTDIFVMDADGGNVRRLTDDKADDLMPEFSPDSDEVVFVSNRGRTNFDLYVVRLDRNGRKVEEEQVTNNAGNEEYPRWSPDGRYLVFQTNRNGNEDVYVLNTQDPAKQTPIANTSDDETWPAWSPDSNHIVFSKGKAGNWALYFAPVTGRTATRIPTDSGSTIEAAWSPTGSAIAYTYRNGNDWEIRISLAPSGL